MIRHAEAEGNIYRRAHGHFNGLIVGRGYEQIRQLEERFSREKIDAVYSSDRSRTQTTAAAICETRGLPVYAEKRLREVNAGEWEDVAWGDIKHRYPEMSEYFGNDPARWSVVGGEKYGDVRKRMRECISDIGKRHDGQTVAAFSHGFAIRAFICELMGIPSHMTELVPYCDNTAVALIRYENDKFEIEYHGDNSHLHSGSSTFEKQTWWRGEKERKSEDMSYMPFDEKRDAGLFELCGRERRPEPDKKMEFIALLEDEPAGVLELDIFKESGDNVGWISRIYIKPELRHMYFGIQLLGQAVSEYRKLRRESVRLEAEAGSPLTCFCEKYGFAKTGESGSLCVMEKNIRNW